MTIHWRKIVISCYFQVDVKVYFNNANRQLGLYASMEVKKDTGNTGFAYMIVHLVTMDLI